MSHRRVLLRLPGLLSAVALAAVACAAGRPQEVLAWVGAHLPPGMFALPAVPGVLTQRELVVLAARWPGSRRSSTGRAVPRPVAVMP